MRIDHRTASMTISRNLDSEIREKGRYLTQSYDKIPFTNINIKGQSDNTKRHHKVLLHSDCGPTKDGQLELLQPPNW